MISTNQFKTGLALVVEGQLYLIVEYEHVKPGKGAAFVRTKLRNVKTGAILSKTFDAGEKFEDAFIAKRPLQFLYRSAGQYHFMDLENYEQHQFGPDELGDAVRYLIENLQVTGEFYEERLVGLGLPTTVVLKVDQSDPGLKGDTSKAATKPALLETGYRIQVPLFVGPSDLIRVDTRTGEYLGRA